MTQREVALEHLYEAVGACVVHRELHIPGPIAAAYIDVRNLTPKKGECEVCHDADADTVAMKPSP